MSALPSNKFDFLCQDVRKRSGLVLGQEKAYLIDSRLGPLARKEGFASVEALIDAMMRGDQRICVAASEALATHETFFFRDKTPFDLFENVIAPALKTARMGRQLKIWCAAASSGQEPYSLGMLLDEIPGLSADILATDMSAPVLEKAKAGIYTQFEVPDSRRVFAVFEQPDLKATFQFTVTAPASWKVISNSPTPSPYPAARASQRGSSSRRRGSRPTSRH